MANAHRCTLTISICVLKAMMIHLRDLPKVFQRLITAKLKLKPTNYSKGVYANYIDFVLMSHCNSYNPWISYNESYAQWSLYHIK